VQQVCHKVIHKVKDCPEKKAANTTQVKASEKAVATVKSKNTKTQLQQTA
jgi:hypothetical protein